MNRKAAAFLSNAVIALGASSGEGAETSMTVERLRCEYLVNPVGIDVMLPRLGWIVTSGRRGDVQSACQVLVASRRETLAADRGDLWDSGRMETSQTAHIAYAGVPLVSRQECFWKVRVWDAAGNPSPFTETATWEMGLLEPEDWHGRWIGTGREILPVTSLEGANWIWLPQGELVGDETTGTAYFRRAVDIPTDRKAQSARLRITAQGPAVVYWNGDEIGRTSGVWDQPLSVDLMPELRSGRNLLAVMAEATTGSAAEAITDTAGMAANLEVVFDSGGILQVPSDKKWKPAYAAGDGWQKPDFDDSVWKNAAAGKPWGEAPWTLSPEPDSRANAAPAPMLRRGFNLDGEVKRARLSVCGLGYHDLYLNGERVGDHLLDPAYTDYEKRVLYVTHDVTPYLRSGKNAVGVMLGTGWYDVHTLAVWNFDAAPWRSAPKLILEMQVELADGRTVTVSSDDGWKLSTGPVIFDSIYEGETYDARKEKPGWATADYDDSGWEPVRLVEKPTGPLRAQMLPPIRVKETLIPKKVTEPKPGVFVYDMGVNMVGLPELSIEGPAGTTVTMRCGERLGEGGILDQEEIAVYTVKRDPRQRLQADVYILKGEGREVWEPRFSYNGFQYVEVNGAPGPLALDNLRGKVIHTDLEPVGRFTCSNPLLNRIHDATLRAYLGNLHGIPTDCPTREKNGWTGDAHLATELGLFNYDGASFYTKWLNDVADAQRPDGDLPGIVPSSGWGYGIGIGPAWDSAYLHIPWDLYRVHGDTRILETHYDGMRQYVDLLTTRADEGIVSYGLGDWLPFDTQTTPALTSTSYYYRDAVILSEAAALLGKDEDARKYAGLAAEIRDAFNKRFFDPKTGQYDNGSQTALSCALYQGLVEPEHVEAVVANLVAAVEKRDFHIDTGLLGSKYLLNALLDNGRADVAYRVASQKTLPSWGWWIEEHGATTLWEQWNGKDSRNHIMFGEIDAWFYKALAGIRVQEPGFRKFVIRPQVVGDLTSARGEYLSANGRIISDWKLADGRITLDVEIPSNTTATVYVPTSGNGAQVTESGSPAKEAEGVRFVREDTGAAVYEVGGGRYRFEGKF